MFHIRHIWVVKSSYRFRLRDKDLVLMYGTSILYRCTECGKDKTKSINGWFDEI